MIRYIFFILNGYLLGIYTNMYLHKYPAYLFSAKDTLGLIDKNIYQTTCSSYLAQRVCDLIQCSFFGVLGVMKQQNSILALGQVNCHNVHCGHTTTAIWVSSLLQVLR